MKNKTVYNISKMVWLVFLMCFCSFGTVFAAQEPTPTTKVTITDTDTGEIISYFLPRTNNKVSTIDDDGNTIITESFVIEDAPKTKAGQTNTDNFSGWKGKVTITYTDDGNYACLTNVSWSWLKESSSTTSTITNMSLNYGQALGTNSKNGYQSNAGYSGALKTGFLPGKYGYNLNMFLGATLNAKIANNQVAVQCNVNY